MAEIYLQPSSDTNTTGQRNDHTGQSASPSLGETAVPVAPGSTSPFDCRPGCGACCIALSISSPIPGMPHGKPAGVRCAQLSDDNRCLLFGKPERPAVCSGLRPMREMCGETREEALAYLATLEAATRPDA